MIYWPIDSNRWSNETWVDARSRISNLATAEIKIFLDLLSGKRGEMEESKKTDASSMNEKEKEWTKIVMDSIRFAVEFQDRDAKSLKLLWKCLKINAKKKNAGGKREVRRTMEADRHKIPWYTFFCYVRGCGCHPEGALLDLIALSYKFIARTKCVRNKPNKWQ